MKGNKMKKTIAAALMASILMASSPASAIEPTDALMVIVKMEAAKQYCGFQPDAKTLNDMLSITLPHVNMTDQQFVARIRYAADELGKEYIKAGTMHQFCNIVADAYAKGK